MVRSRHRSSHHHPSSMMMIMNDGVGDAQLTSQELFELVASRDHDGLGVLYAQVGLHALQERTMAAHRERAEEKMEESGFWHSPARRGGGSSSNHSEQMAMYTQLLRELSLFVTQKEDNASTAATLPHKKKSKVEVSADAEQLLRDAVAAFSDARPPTNFVVFEDSTEDVMSQTTNHSRRSSNSHNNGAAVDGRRDAATAIDGPPIFDGSVANATPQTRGAGTILHLACALDEPLCLAFGLAMGADARASHTAFRRLMIHEAACNGSIQCLTLLLELGRLYGSTVQDNDADAKLPPRMSRHSRAFELPFLPRRLDRSDVMAPLHIYAYQESHPPPPTQHHMPPSSQPYLQPPQQHMQMEQSSYEQNTNATSDPFNSADRKKKTPQKASSGADFLTLLQSFRMYSRQVKDGELSELDAARKVLQLATLSESSQMSLARSCAFNTSSAQREHPEMALRNRARHHGYHNSSNSTSDGHGNTPLHWAAFKNEKECVSLLLSYGANPNARAYPSGWTPLHDAAYSNSTESVELLIDAGATVDARANSGATPLCFAAQEDSAQSAELLLQRGADLSARCSGGPVRDDGTLQPLSTSRFSGYTPLHYCAHYNAKAAASVLLKHRTAHVAMEIPDLNDRLPIHVAVARGSSAVLRELLHAGARVVTRPSGESNNADLSDAASTSSTSSPIPTSPSMAAVEPSTPRRRTATGGNAGGAVRVVSTPVSSPVLRSMIPSQPVTSSKPWNCLSQQAIDECRYLIHEAEQHWSPVRNDLFTPADRRSVLTLLMTGKRLEQSHGVFWDLWPQVLSFCGRGWFDPIDPSLAPTIVLLDSNNNNAQPAAASKPIPTSALYYTTTTPGTNTKSSLLSLLPRQQQQNPEPSQQQQDGPNDDDDDHDGNNNTMESSIYEDSLSLPTL